MQDNEPINITYGQLSDMINRIEQIPSLFGEGAPTGTTPAFHLGQTYVDTLTGKSYYCSGIIEESGAPLEFNWQEGGKTYVAGQNVQINGNEISATDTTYTAGTGLNLNGTQFSVNTSTIAQKSDIKDATLTIQRNGSRVGTFSANASSNRTVNITVPTNNNELTNGAGYQTSSQVSTAIATETTARQNADVNLQGQIDAIVASSDVKDIVGTKAELNNYDTSTLGNNDIIKVLQDESENNATTYYRWNATTQQFSLIGEEGPYYTKSQADTLLNAKQNTLTAGPNVQIVNDAISATDTTYTAGTGLALNGTQFSVDTATVATQSDLTAGLATKQDTLTAGTNVQINNNVISATDTTYSDFTGTDGTTAGTAGLVPAPATTDAGKFLKGDGTWGTVQAGSSYTAGDGIDITNDVISATNTGKAKVLTSADYNYPTTGTKTSVALWLLEPGIYTKTDSSVTVRVSSQGTMPVGATAVVGRGTGFGTPIIYLNADYISDTGNTAGTVYVIGGIGDVLNSWRLAAPIDKLTSTGITIPLSAKQGKVLKDLIDSLAIRGAGAPTTSTAGQVGTLYEDTTNGKLYICTDATNPYVWEEVGGGSGPTVVQTTGTSTTDVMSQNAVTQTLFDGTGASLTNHIAIGTLAATQGSKTVNASVSIGDGARANGQFGIAIGGYGSNGQFATAAAQGIAIGGYNPNASGEGSIAIGIYGATASGKGSIALGYASSATTQGQMDIGSTDTSYGYNNSNYRLLTGLYDPQSAHDAATKGYVDNSLLGKQDALTAGSGISIADESGSLVISTTVAEPDEFTSSEWNALWS